jgi:hypothetical protein
VREIPFDFAQGKLSLRLKNGSAQDDAGRFAGKKFQSGSRTEFLVDSVDDAIHSGVRHTVK